MELFVQGARCFMGVDGVLQCRFHAPTMLVTVLLNRLPPSIAPSFSVLNVHRGAMKGAVARLLHRHFMQRMQPNQ